MAFRFIHAADLHLDSPLRSLALRNPEAAALIGDASRQALRTIVDLCMQEKVDALLIAGDLYDGEQTSMKTALFLAAEMRRLHGAGIDVYLIRGNHDALSRITRELSLPENVHNFGSQAEAKAITREATDFPVVIHGLSFAQPHAPESLLSRFLPPVEGAINIGLLHTSLDGAPGHDPYAPCSVSELKAAGFDYWALGHIHKRAIYEWEDGRPGAIVMPGIPQGRDVNEAGPKGVSLVTIGDDRSVRIEERLTSLAEFSRIEICVDGLTSWRDVVLAIDRSLEVSRGKAQSSQLVARLELTGRTPLAWRMRRDADLLATEADDRAASIGRTLIDRVVLRDIDTREPEAPDGDPVAELKALMNAEIIQDPSFNLKIKEMAEELRGQLPPECRDIFGRDEAGIVAEARALAQEGVEEVLAHLRESRDEG